MEITTSPNVSNFDFEVELDISVPVPKATVTDISTYIGGGAANIIGIVVRIIDPSNLALPQTVYPPNVDIVPGLTATSKNLPYFNGQVKWGNYQISATLIDADGTQYAWVGDDGATTKTINLCKPNALSNAVLNYGGLKLDVDPNCDLGLLIVQDGGTGFSYNGVSPAETTTALTITYPIDTTGTVNQQTATFIPFTFPLTVAGIYSIQGTVTQTYQLTSTTYTIVNYYYQNTFDIQCGYTLCKALCDYERLVADVQACSLKNPNEAYQQLKTLILVVSYLGKIAWFKQCGKKFGNVLEELRKIASFSCNCECNPQGIAPAPLLFGGGTIVKGNMCGDIDMNLTQFMGNVQIDLSDVSYSVVASANDTDFLTITPTDGECSKIFTVSIDVCAMLGTVSIGCLSDVNVGSPAPDSGDVLTYNGSEWIAADPSSMLYNNWTDVTRTTIGTNKSYVMPAGTMSSDGDMLIIRAHITGNQTSAPLIGVVDLSFAGAVVESMSVGSSLRQADIEVQLTRISETSIRYKVIEQRGIFNQIDSSYIYVTISTVVAVPSLATNATTISTITSFMNSVGLSITNEILSVELVKV